MHQTYHFSTCKVQTTKAIVYQLIVYFIRFIQIVVSHFPKMSIGLNRNMVWVLNIDYPARKLATTKNVHVDAFLHLCTIHILPCTCFVSHTCRVSMQHCSVQPHNLAQPSLNTRRVQCRPTSPFKYDSSAQLDNKLHGPRSATDLQNLIA